MDDRTDSFLDMLLFWWYSLAINLLWLSLSRVYVEEREFMPLREALSVTTRGFDSALIT
jgi:hypothetical protein